MKRQCSMRYLRMGCGESLAVSQMKLSSGVENKSTQTHKPDKSKEIRRRQGNEGDR